MAFQLSTQVYDTHTGKWATIAAEVPRSDLGAIWNDAGDVGLLGPHIFVAGGYDEKYTVAYTETLKINPETGDITPGANLLTGRGDLYHYYSPRPAVRGRECVAIHPRPHP